MRLIYTLLLPPALGFSPQLHHARRSIPSTELGVLFPNRKGIVVEPDGNFVAKDPLIDDFMGRRSSANDVLRNDNIPRGEPQGASFSGDAMNRGYVDPSQMRLRDIQLELQNRNVYYGDCFDMESLVHRLREARGDNVWEEKDATNDSNFELADDSYMYSETEQSNYEWNNQNPVQVEHEQDPAYYSNDGNGGFTTPFNSHEWVYDTPMPPNMPPPEFIDQPFDSR